MPFPGKQGAQESHQQGINWECDLCPILLSGQGQFCHCHPVPSPQVHSHRHRKAHRPRRLHIPEEFQSWSARGCQQVPREKLELFAVLCIETSHYVSFVKYGPGNEHWMFFDSMADRHGEGVGMGCGIWDVGSCQGLLSPPFPLQFRLSLGLASIEVDPRVAKPSRWEFFQVLPASGCGSNKGFGIPSQLAQLVGMDCSSVLPHFIL